MIYSNLIVLRTRIAQMNNTHKYWRASLIEGHWKVSIAEHIDLTILNIHISKFLGSAIFFPYLQF